MATRETEVGTFEAKNTLSALIDRAARGERIWITKRGRRMALLSSGSESPGVRGGGLVGQFRAIREQVRPGTESMKELIEEGRR